MEFEQLIDVVRIRYDGDALSERQLGRGRLTIGLSSRDPPTPPRGSAPRKMARVVCELHSGRHAEPASRSLETTRTLGPRAAGAGAGARADGPAPVRRRRLGRRADCRRRRCRCAAHWNLGSERYHTRVLWRRLPIPRAWSWHCLSPLAISS